jgi:hypothetical protein
MPRLFELVEGVISLVLEAVTWAFSVAGLLDSVSFASGVSAAGASVVLFAASASASAVLLLAVACDGAASGRAKDEAIMAGSTGAPGTVG